jgi:hypothetical protein
MKRAGAADIVAPQPRESIEYVGGPWNGETEMRLDLPSEIPTPDGIYSRSVRCVDDGAMRYVWRAGWPAEVDGGGRDGRPEAEPRRLVSQLGRD